MNKYFMAKQEDDILDVTIFGDITSWEWFESDVSSYTLSKLIQQSDAKTIVVRINSYGGEVAEGLAIYNSLKNSPAKVITRCDGFACSAASVVFMAGDEREMNDASLLMIHNAWTTASGNAAELRKQADDLEVISKTVANTYLSHVSISEEELQALLDAETWITPADAVAMGFATCIVAETVTKQQYSAKNNIIRQLVEGHNKPEMKPEGEPEQTIKPAKEEKVVPVQQKGADEPELEPVPEPSAEPESAAEPEDSIQKLFGAFIK